MRFVILAAAAALGMSAPSNAAALWTFEINTTFQVRGSFLQFLCYDPPGACTPITPINEDVPTSFLISVPEFTTSTSGGQALNGFLGYSLDPRQSFIAATLRWEGNNIVVDSATLQGGDSGCSLGRPPCTEVNFRGTGINSYANFVSSVNGPGPVPEPTTWALMIGGFGMVGGTMRYRRRKTTVSFA